MQSEQINELAAALAKAQAAIKNATYNRVNPHFKNKYADLAACFDAVRKPLSDHGLSVTQTTEVREGGMVLVTRLMHTSGQWIRGEYPLPASGRPQEIGSALTYAKRYSLSSIAGIAADDDDDAEAATERGHKRNGNDRSAVTQEQAENLLAMVNEVGADPDKFCAYLKINSLLDLPAARYAEAVKALEAKRVKQ